MKRSALVTCLLAWLAACTTPANSTEYITYYLNKGFATHPVSEFFYDYGYAAGETDLDNGKVYRWTSVVHHKATVDKYAGDPSRGENYVENYKLSYQSVDSNYIARQYCEVLVYTDNNDNIRDFRVTVDSIGKHSPSRCSEIFDRVYP